MGEMIKYAVKTAIALAVGGAIVFALTTIISWITNGLSNPVGILAEAISFVLLLLPINASGLNVLGLALSAVIAFYVAFRVYVFMTYYLESTN